MRVDAVASAVALAFATGCASTFAKVNSATAPVAGPPLHFLERNYIFWTLHDTTLIYEGHPSAHLFLYDGLSRAYDHLTRADSTAHPFGHAWAMRIFTSPMFRIRQLKDSSAAVRTPSFKPRILALERVDVFGLGQPQQLPGGFVRYRNVFLSGARLALIHHSNGQAGCFRQGYRPTDATITSCEPSPITDTTKVLPRDTLQVTLNGSDGDFSSTYVNGTVHGTWMWDFRHGDTPRYTLGAAIGYDWHARGLFGELTDEQRQLYGGWRVRLQTEGMYVSGLTCADSNDARPLLNRVGCFLRGRTRATFEGERGPVAAGPLHSRINPAILPWRGSIEVSHAFHWLLGAGAFIRLNDGQDYYNIGFVNRHRATMYGVMLDVGGSDVVKRRDPTSP